MAASLDGEGVTVVVGDGSGVDGAPDSASGSDERDTDAFDGGAARGGALVLPSGSGSPKNCHKLPMVLPQKSKSSSNDCNSADAGVGGVCETMG